MLALNLILAIGPALLVLLWAYRRDSGRPEPAGLVVRAFGLGFVAVAIALAAGLALTSFGGLFSGIGNLAYQAYFVAGLLEEGAKLAVVMFFVARHREFDEVADGIVYTMAASLGFAVLENVLYLGQEPILLLTRGLTAVPAHAVCGGIMGYFVGQSRIESRGSATTGLLIAVAVHGTYDFLLFIGGPASLATIPLLVVSFLVVRALFRVAVARDQAAGRTSPRMPNAPLTRPPKP